MTAGDARAGYELPAPCNDRPAVRFFRHHVAAKSLFDGVVRLFVECRMQLLVCAEWGWAEYRDAMASLVGRRQNSGAALAEMLEAWKLFCPGVSLLPVNRGRVALRLALQAFARCAPDKTEVVYPAYICGSVIAAIEHAGLTPVPADIGPNLNMGVMQAMQVVNNNTLAVVAVHIYGCPAPVGEFEEFCRSRGIFLIDDAATLGGVAADDGRMLGGFGDVGVISFTASKTIVAGGFNAGGLLLVNKPELASAMRREWEALPAPRFRLSDFLLFLRDQPLETYTRAATYYWSAARRRFSPRHDGRHACPPARMPNISARIALRQLGSLRRRIAGRIGVAEGFHRGLAALPGIAFPQYQQGRYLTRIVLQLPEGSDLAAVRAGLRRQGIETRRGYDLDLRYGDRFPRARAVAPLLVEVPSHSQMEEAAIQRICGALGEIVGSVRHSPSRTQQSAAAE